MDIEDRLDEIRFKLDALRLAQDVGLAAAVQKYRLELLDLRVELLRYRMEELPGENEIADALEAVERASS